MKKSANKTLFFSLLLVIFIAIVGYTLGKNINPTNNSNSSNTNNSIPTNSTKTTDQTKSTTQAFDVKGKIAYFNRDSSGTDIYTVVYNQQPRKVYTDKDEDLKIKSAESLTSSGKVLSVMAAKDQEFGGSLYLIATDSSAKKDKLVDQFASTQAPAISPNSKYIAYVLFDNSEANYGFSLYIMKSDGTNKLRLAQDSANIKIFSWSSDSKQIAFLKGSETNSSNIYLASIDGSDAKELTSFKEKIYWLSWATDGIVLSKGPNDQSQLNKSELYKMDNNGKNLKRLTNNDSFENYPYVSPDGKFITFLTVNYDKNVDVNKSGNIEIIDQSGQNQNKITEGNYIIGWIEWEKSLIL